WGFDMVISSITFDYEDSIMQIIPVEIENVEIEMGSVLTIDTRIRFMGEEDWRRASMIPFLSAGLSISSSSWFESAGLWQGRPSLGHPCAACPGLPPPAKLLEPR